MGRIGNWFKNAWERTKETAGKVGRWAKETALPWVKENAGKIIKTAGKVMKFIPGIPGIVNELVEKSGDAVDDLVNKLPDGSVKKRAQELVDRGKEAINKGTDIVKGVTDEVAKYTPAVDALGNLVG